METQGNAREFKGAAILLSTYAYVAVKSAQLCADMLALQQGNWRVRIIHHTHASSTIQLFD